MRNEPQSLYQILGVPSDAKPNDIERAYRRIKAELQKETAPPDPRLRVMLEHAHDVLMDPVRREAYDKQWFAPRAQIVRARRSPAAIASIVAAMVAVAAAAWFSTRSPSAPARAARPKQEVQSAVALAVGRVSRIEMSGAASPLGLAFAIAEGTLVTSCEGLAPNAEVVVKFGKREAPVRVSLVDEPTRLCKLTGGSVGSWPLELARSEPQSEEPVYFVAMPAGGGDAQLADTRFKRAMKAGTVRGFVAELPPNVHDLGGPLIDIEGRVIGAASRIDGTTLYAPVPHEWLPDVPVQRSVPQQRSAGPEPKNAPERPPGPDVSPERRERLEKAFRPPPQVPDDI